MLSATIGLMGGKAVVGPSPHEIKRIARLDHVRKGGSRDVAVFSGCIDPGFLNGKSGSPFPSAIFVTFSGEFV